MCNHAAPCSPASQLAGSTASAPPRPVQDGDEEAQEAAVVPLLNQALAFAAEGVAVHHSPNCLGMCDQLLAILCGRPGARPGAARIPFLP